MDVRLAPLATRQRRIALADDVPIALDGRNAENWLGRNGGAEVCVIQSFFKEQPSVKDAVLSTISALGGGAK